MTPSPSHTHRGVILVLYIGHTADFLHFFSRVRNRLLSLGKRRKLKRHLRLAPVFVQPVSAGNILRCWPLFVARGSLGAAFDSQDKEQPLIRRLRHAHKVSRLDSSGLVLRPTLLSCQRLTNYRRFGPSSFRARATFFFAPPHTLTRLYRI